MLYRHKIPFLQLENYEFDTNIVKLIPEEMARHYQVIALDRLESVEKPILTIGMVNPEDTNVINLLEKRLNCFIRLFRVDLEKWASTVNEVY